MNRAFRALLILIVLCDVRAGEEAASGFQEKGFQALKESQTEPRAIVNAARAFAKASELYEAEGNSDKAVEMNSYLYWCKKKMTLGNIEEFTKSGETGVVAKLTAVEKAEVNAEDAQQWYDRAENFAAANANEPLLIAVRFYEVADRFKGTEISLKAQDKSLQAMGQVTGSKAQPTNPAPAAKSAVAPLPGEAEQKVAEKQIRDIFREDFLKTNPGEKHEFALKLLQQGEDAKDDAATRYVLWKTAAQIAAQNGESELVLALIERFETSFAPDAKLKHALLAATAQNAKSPDLKRALQGMATLADKPDEAAANFAVGKYFSIAACQWDKGVSYLAKGSDAALKNLAKRDLATPADAAKQIDTGDMWWEAAAKERSADIRFAERLRAQNWYEKALPATPALSKIKLEKRIAEIKWDVYNATLAALSPQLRSLDRPIE